jgi:hypothetical protein
MAVAEGKVVHSVEIQGAWRERATRDGAERADAPCDGSVDGPRASDTRCRDWSFRAGRAGKATSCRSFARSTSYYHSASTAAGAEGKATKKPSPAVSTSAPP